MDEQQHAINWARSGRGPKWCQCGAPWRAGDCSARRDEFARTPFSELPTAAKVGVVTMTALGLGALVALAVTLAEAIGWMP